MNFRLFSTVTNRIRALSRVQNRVEKTRSGSAALRFRRQSNAKENSQGGQRKGKEGKRVNRWRWRWQQASISRTPSGVQRGAEAADHRAGRFFEEKRRGKLALVPSGVGAGVGDSVGRRGRAEREFAVESAAMALRMASQRWTSSPLVQTVMRSATRQQQIRAFADEYTGRALDDKEKAAENRYIRKMEEEQKLRKAATESSGGATPAGEASPLPGTDTPAAAKDGGYMGTAVVAGIVAAIAGYWLLSGSSKKKDNDKEIS